MAGYRFYPPADLAQDRIWRDTEKTWGEQQAKTYIIGLHRHLDKLSRQPVLWRKLPASLLVPTDLDREIWLSRYQRHFIIFRELSDGRIGVISILHERMDLPMRLADDLLSINSKGTD